MARLPGGRGAGMTAMSAAPAHFPALSVAAERELRAVSRDLGKGAFETRIWVPGARCAACISAIEGTLSRLPGVLAARVNLTTRQVVVQWRDRGAAPDFCAALDKSGYEASLIDRAETRDDAEMVRLMRATAVVGFAAMNIMLLSISVWLGADANTRQAFHLWSALLAAPAVAYSGRIFFVSAWRALSAWKTNMDVPISVGILLTFALSVFDTYTAGPHAYFDAVTSLMFALLAGRTLDHAMRRKAEDAVAGLSRLMPREVTILRAGQRHYCALAEVEPGDIVEMKPGDRFAVDGTIVEGRANIDVSAVTGETAPLAGSAGRSIYSGSLNLDGHLLVRADKRADASFLADMSRMMAAAQEGRARYRLLADRAAALYSPVVHALALATLVGWLILTSDWHASITPAVAVLVITCPCALGLAVPMAHVMAARRLFALGVTFKDGGALERLAEVTTVVFDKTGTLTTGRMQVSSASVSAPDIGAAAALASLSRHPVAQAVASYGASAGAVADFRELPGMGIEGAVGGLHYRLGRRSWIAPGEGDEGLQSAVWLAREGRPVGWFAIADQARPGAEAAVRTLGQLGIATEILSGDIGPEVQRTAQAVGIAAWRAGALPADKVSRIQHLADAGHRVLMVGDGLNDTPALAAACVSMAPSSATDTGRSAADFVFIGDSLQAVPGAIGVARAARRIVHQNLALAIAYNVMAVPLAVAGQVTPLIAAIAMASSSLLVVANSMRLSPLGREQRYEDRRVGLKPARTT